MTRTYPQRGEIWMVDFDPALGSEIQKRRPAVVIQNDIANEFSPTTIVAAITSTKLQRVYPVDIALTAGEGALHRNSYILLSQIRTVDKTRLTQFLGKLSPSKMQKVNTALMISMGIIA